jgi:hypothetical protein
MVTDAPQNELIPDVESYNIGEHFRPCTDLYVRIILPETKTQNKRHKNGIAYLISCRNGGKWIIDTMAITSSAHITTSFTHSVQLSILWQAKLLCRSASKDWEVVVEIQVGQ